jgi:hypothetical protein
LATYLLVDVPKKMRNEDPTFAAHGSPRGGQAAIGRRLKDLHFDKKTEKVVLEYEDILARMNLYAISPSLWKRGRHPAVDFLDGSTQAMLGNILSSSRVTDIDDDGEMPSMHEGGFARFLQGGN